MFQSNATTYLYCFLFITLTIEIEEMSLTKRITRQSFDCPIFGHPRDFLPNILPTHEDVLRCCFEERFVLASKLNNTKVSFSSVSNVVAKKVKYIYEKASIPTVSYYRIIQLINAYYDKYCKLMKSYIRDKEKPNFIKKVEELKKQGTELFDISGCKCEMNLYCSCKTTPDLCECPILINCTCEKPNKIPVIEHRFIYLQRKYGMGKIGTLDQKETNKLRTRLLRRNNTLKRQPSKPVEDEIKETEDIDEIQQSFNAEVESNNHDHYKPSCSKKKEFPWQMRLTLQSTSLNCDRYGVSDRAAAAIASSVLEDIGVISETDTSLVIDRHKIRREKSRTRKELQQSQLDLDELHGIYFDGRKDHTLVIEKIGSKQFRRTIKEEHYSIIKEPGSDYLSHVSPNSSSAKDITASIVSCLTERGVSLEFLDVVGCDGTNTNTGWKGGAIRQLEVHLGRPLQWAICLLHFVELPFRHLFQHLDGETSGPRSFMGTIGKNLIGCEKLSVVNFQLIDCEIPEVDMQLLSKDQRYLFDISQAIKSGNVPNDLSNRDPGPISHARWLTCANRILRLYVAVENPSYALIDIVTYILKSYMPVWFEIKCSKYITNGPIHLYRAIETSRYLPGDLKKVVFSVIERNSFFAHPENLLMAMVFDDRKHIRELGLRRVLKARQTVPKGKGIRNFITPTLNFDAVDYTQLIDWNVEKISSPPLLRRVTNEEIHSFIQSGDIPDWDVKKFPCHTQAVERCVKLVTEASLKVCGPQSRDGFIRATLKSRSMMQEFNTKSQYKVATKSQT